MPCRVKACGRRGAIGAVRAWLLALVKIDPRAGPWRVSHLYQIDGGRFLDLCAGSGAVGIEALSRGAAHVTFVDRSRRMCALIEKNLYTLGVEDEVEVVLAEASEFLRRYAEKQALVFDIVFFDPPYATDYEGVLKYFGEHATRLLAEDSLVIVEHHKKRDLKEKFSRVHRYRTLKQGDSLLSFYQMT